MIGSFHAEEKENKTDVDASEAHDDADGHVEVEEDVANPARSDALSDLDVRTESITFLFFFSHDLFCRYSMFVMLAHHFLLFRYNLTLTSP